MSSSRRFYYCCLLSDRDNDTGGGLLLLHSVSVDLIRRKTAERRESQGQIGRGKVRNARGVDLERITPKKCRL